MPNLLIEFSYFFTDLHFEGYSLFLNQCMVFILASWLDFLFTLLKFLVHPSNAWYHISIILCSNWFHKLISYYYMQKQIVDNYFLSMREFDVGFFESCVIICCLCYAVLSKPGPFQLRLFGACSVPPPPTAISRTSLSDINKIHYAQYLSYKCLYTQITNCKLKQVKTHNITS